MKVGIIRCQQTEDLCPATTCIKCASAGKLAFEGVGPSEIVGIVSCGGCPGKRAVSRAKMLVDRGAEVIALASCIFKGTPIGFPVSPCRADESGYCAEGGGEHSSAGLHALRMSSAALKR